MEGNMTGGLFLVAGGIFTLVATAKEWKFFMNHWKTGIWKNVFGEKGVKIFYYIVGAGLIVAGLLFMLGVIKVE